MTKIHIATLAHETPEGDRIDLSIDVVPGTRRDDARVAMTFAVVLTAERAFDALGPLTHAIETARRRPIVHRGAVFYLDEEDET